MNEARDIPGVIAPPPLIALTTFLLGLVLDWFLALFMLREVSAFGHDSSLAQSSLPRAWLLRVLGGAVSCKQGPT